MKIHMRERESSGFVSSPVQFKHKALHAEEKTLLLQEERRIQGKVSAS